MFAHTPYDGSSKPFTIAMRPLDLQDWIEPDHALTRDLAEKDSLIAAKQDVVFRECPETRAAQQEALDLLAEFLPRRFPTLYARRGAAIEVGGRSVALDGGAPLLVASRLVQEDLCLMTKAESGWRLSAASVCFPSTWSLAEKLGLDMNRIHMQVPGFQGRTHEIVTRIFDQLKVEHPTQRLNWSIYGDGRLHHPETKSDPHERFPDNSPALERAHIRVERQTIRKLKTSQAILFTIRVYADPLARLADHPDGASLARSLREQLLALAPEELRYKGLAEARERLAEELEALALSAEPPYTGGTMMNTLPLQSAFAFDGERNRLTARASRYAQVGARMGGAAARMAGARLTGAGAAGDAIALAAALGGLKGPLMKVAQLMATIPDLLPPEYAAEFQKLQSEAPPMGAAFVKRRMMAELGPAWRDKFDAFDLHPAGAASLGQVHRASDREGRLLACKLQYPDMASAVEADLRQLDVLFSLHRRMDGAIDTSEIKKEIAARVREELNYRREARHAALYHEILADSPDIRVPRVRADLTTSRLLTMDWLSGEKVLAFRRAPQEERDAIGHALFRAWWRPFIRYGVIHGDPHLGNYSVFRAATGPNANKAAGVNLYDFGCVRIFPPRFVQGVVDLYRGLLENDRARVVSAYKSWGFRGLTEPLVDVMNMWARFIYGPILDDRVRTVADGVSPADYGRKEAYRVHMALKEKGPMTVPQEFVFMDRAAIGLGAVFLHLDAKLNFHRIFNEALEGYSLEALAERQAAALDRVGLPRPD